MSYYDAETYGERIAQIYDVWYGKLNPEAAVAFLSSHQGPGPVLELEIGTGRLALPLLDERIEVHGADASPAMVSKLRKKPGRDRISVTVSDFAKFDLTQEFSLVFVAFNTFFGLLCQKGQIDCFQSVADHLCAGEVFIIEAFVPDLGRFDRGRRVSTTRITDDSVLLDVSERDSVHQRVNSRHIHLTEKGIEIYRIQIRYAWPSELDLIAQLAGLALKERWCGWNRHPFTAQSGNHVSVYAKSA